MHNVSQTLHWPLLSEFPHQQLILDRNTGMILPLQNYPVFSHSIIKKRNQLQVNLRRPGDLAQHCIFSTKHQPTPIKGQIL